MIHMLQAFVICVWLLHPLVRNEGENVFLVNEIVE